MSIDLSDQQIRILRLRADGWSGQQILRGESISLSTLERYEREIRAQLGARNIAHAVYLGCRAGLLDGRPQRHGDHAGFRAHERRGEDPWACASCAAGERAYRDGRKNTRGHAAAI